MAEQPARPVPEFGREHDHAVAARASPTKRLLALSLPALLIGVGSALGLIAIVAWVAEIDIVFQESAEEQEPNRKSLVIDGASSGQKADVQ